MSRKHHRAADRVVAPDDDSIAKDVTPTDPELKALYAQALAVARGIEDYMQRTQHPSPVHVTLKQRTGPSDPSRDMTDEEAAAKGLRGWRWSDGKLHSTPPPSKKELRKDRKTRSEERPWTDEETRAVAKEQMRDVYPKKGRKA